MRVGKNLTNGVLLLLVAYIIVYPILWVFMGSVQNSQGQWTLENFGAIYNVYYLTIILRTLWYGACSVALSLVIAVPLAWVINRTDLGWKRTIRALVIVNFVMPPLFHALAFVFMFKPDAGFINNLFNSVFGIQPFDIYTFEGLVFATACGLYPLIFILVDATLRNIDPSHEEAAAICGSSRWKTVRTVTFPLVMPSILSGVLLGLLEVFATFGPPAIIGIPSKIYVMTTQLYVDLSSSPPRIERGAALSVIFLAIAYLLVFIQQKALRNRSYVTIGGKGIRHRLLPLGGWRWPILAVIALTIFISLLAPTLALVMVSFSKVWSAGFAPENLTFSYYHDALFLRSDIFSSFSNTVIVSLTTMFLAILLGGPIAWAVVKRGGPIANLLKLITFLPLSVPGVVFTIGVILTFIQPPLVLYGTLSIIVVCYLGRFLPFAVQPLSDALRQVDMSLIEAARVMGSSAGHIVRKITLPLLKGSLISAALLVFISCVREIVSIALLYSPGNSTLMMTAMLLWDEGQVQTTSALVVMILLIVVVFYLIVHALPKNGLDRER